MASATEAVKAKTCATIGCGNLPKVTIEYGPADDRSSDDVCRDCAGSYVFRPALRTAVLRELPAVYVITKGKRRHVLALHPAEAQMYRDSRWEVVPANS